MKFKPTHDDLIAVEWDVPGFGEGEMILTIEQARGLREQLDQCIEMQDRTTTKEC